jgi:predicted AAA+ superfamily ATPase
MYITRNTTLLENLREKSVILLGPRQTGKTSLIRETLGSDIAYYNLLDKELFFRLSSDLTLMRKQLAASRPLSGIVVIDEIQRLPELLDEVHLLIEQQGLRFLLTGSSARKLKEKGVNLLGGRARQVWLNPLTYVELGSDLFDLRKALNRGLIPSIYLSNNPRADLGSYVGTYLENEIAKEASVRNLPAFSRFLATAAMCNGQIMNYSSIASDAQIGRKVVSEYFQILFDTLLASEVPAWGKSRKRKPLETSKFYFFDTGIVRAILDLPPTKEKSKDFGDYFEAYIHHELKAYKDCRRPDASIKYWRTTGGVEVDFIFAERVAIEVKAKEVVGEKDLSGIRACMEEQLLEKYIVVSLEKSARLIDNSISILPYTDFLRALWNEEILDPLEPI